jgi:hypothetical protein
VPSTFGGVYDSVGSVLVVELVAGTASTSARSAAIISVGLEIGVVGVSDANCCCLVWRRTSTGRSSARYAGCRLLILPVSGRSSTTAFWTRLGVCGSVGSLVVGVGLNVRLSLRSGLTAGSGTVLAVELVAGTANTSARSAAGTADTSARSAAIVSVDLEIGVVGVSDANCRCLVWGRTRTDRSRPVPLAAVSAARLRSGTASVCMIVSVRWRWVSTRISGCLSGLGCRLVQA